MAVSLAKLKRLSMRLGAEQSELADALATVPPSKSLSRQLLQQLAEIAAAQAAVSREIDVREPRHGWG